jgi:hypothetical protein
MTIFTYTPKQPTRKGFTYDESTTEADLVDWFGDRYAVQNGVPSFDAWGYGWSWSALVPGSVLTRETLPAYPEPAVLYAQRDAAEFAALNDVDASEG